MINPLFLELESAQGYRLKRRSSEPIPDTKLWHLLPEDAREFFTLFVGGVILADPSLQPPPYIQKYLLVSDLSSESVNETFSSPTFPHTYPYYDRCIVFASAVDDNSGVGFDQDGKHSEYVHENFYLCIDLNEDHRGWVFYFKDEWHGPTDFSAYLFRSFSDFIQEATLYPQNVTAVDTVDLMIKENIPVLPQDSM